MGGGVCILRRCGTHVFATPYAQTQFPRCSLWGMGARPKPNIHPYRPSSNYQSHSPRATPAAQFPAIDTLRKSDSIISVVRITRFRKSIYNTNIANGALAAPGFFAQNNNGRRRPVVEKEGRLRRKKAGAGTFALAPISSAG